MGGRITAGKRARTKARRRAKAAMRMGHQIRNQCPPHLNIRKCLSTPRPREKAKRRLAHHLPRMAQPNLCPQTFTLPEIHINTETMKGRRISTGMGKEKV